MNIFGLFKKKNNQIQKNVLHLLEEKVKLKNSLYDLGKTVKALEEQNDFLLNRINVIGGYFEAIEEHFNIRIRKKMVPDPLYEQKPKLIRKYFVQELPKKNEKA